MMIYITSSLTIVTLFFHRHFNLSHAPLYSDMSGLALDEKIKDLVAGNDKLGPEAVRAQLRAPGA
jgi:hypothetical protein